MGKRIALIVSIIAVVVAGGYIVWWLFFSPPSKDDYVSAQKEAEAVANVKGSALLDDYYVAATKEIKAGKKQDQLIKALTDEKKTVEQALEKRSEGAENIGDSRVMRDNEVKKSYDNYLAVERKYATYIRDAMEAFPYFASSLTTCQKVYDVSDQAKARAEYPVVHKKLSVDCLADLSDLKKSSIKPYADYASEFERIVNERQKVFEDYGASRISDAKASEAITKLAAAGKKNNPITAIKEYRDKNMFNGELTALIEVLKKKATAS